MKKWFFIILFLIFCNSYSQDLFRYKKPENINNTTNTVLPVSIVVASVLYLLSPIIMLENDRVNLGFNKEVSIGFGYFGEHRIFADFAYLFRTETPIHIRTGYHYDYMLSDLIPSNSFQTTSVVTFGGGYFTDFHKSGISADVGYGYSIRNDKLLIYPNIKLRYTYEFARTTPHLIDLNFGIMVGFANIFNDLKIRRYKFDNDEEN